MIGARDMIAIKLLSNKAAIKLLSGIRAGVTDLGELAKATGVTFAYARLMVGKLIVNGFVEALRPTDLTGARVTVVERMASLANAIECIDANGQRQERTEWHSVSAWGKLADVCAQHLSKGRQVYVEGRIQSREYQDKDGQQRKVVEIKADQVVFLGPNPGASSFGGKPQGKAPQDKPAAKPNGNGWGSNSNKGFDDDPIPF